MGRYLRLLAALARYGLARELAFRGNFIAKVTVEVLWLGILLVFYRTIFSHTPVVAEWSEPEYLFFVGCYFALGGLIETFFLSNCNEFADLIRSGDLDFLLLKPIDEQFLVSCRNIDWSTLPNVLFGLGVMGFALSSLESWSFDPLTAALFVLTFFSGLGLAYSFLLVLTSTSVWLVRNQSLYEMWWLVSSLMRYPREIFKGPIATPVGMFFTFVVPVMIVVSVPATVMVKALDPSLAAFAVVVTVLMLVVSRKFFRLALTRYRSASS